MNFLNLSGNYFNEGDKTFLSVSKVTFQKKYKDIYCYHNIKLHIS